MKSTHLPHSHLPNKPYIGRFAPSPTGPLHMGSLVSALASFLDARANQGQWLVRMEDLDPPREQPGASSLILKSLENSGLEWDGEVLFQSSRHAAYRDAVNTLLELGLIYYCTCSRQQLRAYPGAYPGFCRHRSTPLPDAALRCLVNQPFSPFTDLLQQEQTPPTEQDDFIVVRKDGLFSYQLAVVIDDYFQNTTHVIRGIDLLDTSSNQRYLQSSLGYPHPDYGHIPIIVDEQGKKLSKQHFATPINDSVPSENLVNALAYLQQAPPLFLKENSVTDILSWAIESWNPHKLVGLKSLPESVPME